jgi:hypothetical protein
MEQPPAARTLRDQSDWLPKVSAITITSPCTAGGRSSGPGSGHG